MDNSPMYDGPDGASDNTSGPILFNTTSHLMALYDVGMTANLASDMEALARTGDAWCASTPKTAPHTTPCSEDAKAKIATLRERAAQLSQLTQEHLWNEDVGAYTNKMPGAEYNRTTDAFYPRVSPTSFYPMMSGVPTPQQADRIVKDHLLNPTGFCVTPKDQWPPQAGAGAGGWAGTVLMQSWTLAKPAGKKVGGGGNEMEAGEAGARTVLCIASTDRDAMGDDVRTASSATGSVGSCSTFKAAGASFMRNESFAWTSATVAPVAVGEAGAGSVGRTPLYQYHLEDGNQIVLGREGDFPAADKMSPAPVLWVANDMPLPGAWPLTLWSSQTPPTAAAPPGGSPSNTTYWRVTASPNSESEVAQARIWTKNATLGYALPLPTACYWGLPSVSFDDPAFASPGAFV